MNLSTDFEIRKPDGDWCMRYDMNILNLHGMKLIQRVNGRVDDFDTYFLIVHLLYHYLQYHSNSKQNKRKLSFGLLLFLNYIEI